MYDVEEIRERLTVLRAHLAATALAGNGPRIIGVTKAYSSAEHLAAVILRIRVLLARFNIVARMRFLPTQCNLIADALSHLRLTEATSICSEWFGRALVMVA